MQPENSSAMTMHLTAWATASAMWTRWQRQHFFEGAVAKATQQQPFESQGRALDVASAVADARLALSYKSLYPQLLKRQPQTAKCG